MGIWWKVALVIAAPMSAAVAPCPAHENASVSPDPVAVVRAVLTAPDSNIDLARAKFAFDQVLDPTIDVRTYLEQIDQIVRTVQSMAGPGASEKLKLTKVRDYLYESGDWNDHRPYEYDMSDPLGRKPGNALLSNYLTTRHGNCVTMPLLYVILAQRLGLDATISVVPFHTFAKITLGTRTFNVEATSGGHVEGDDFYRRKTPMADAAVANGVYMKTLTRREAVAVLADALAAYLLEQKKPSQVLAVTELVLAAYPHDANALVEKGSAYGVMIDQQFREKYPRPMDIPSNLQEQYLALVDKNKQAFDQAEALGWRETEEPQYP